MTIVDARADDDLRSAIPIEVRDRRSGEVFGLSLWTAPEIRHPLQLAGVLEAKQSTGSIFALVRHRACGLMGLGSQDLREPVAIQISGGHLSAPLDPQRGIADDPQLARVVAADRAQ